MFKKKGTYFKKITTLFLLALSVLGVGLTAANQVKASSYSLFADVSSYQSSDASYFTNLATGNVSGVVIKLTQGSSDSDNYINPKAAAQIKSAQAAGMKVSVYHYAKYNGSSDAKAEADFFAAAAAKYGLSKSTVMVADVEDSSVKSPYADTVTFQNELKAKGYTTQCTYSMASWFWAKKLPLNYPIWVANYGVSMPGVDNAAAWQYTSNYNGQNVDMSYDFTGLFTNKSVTQAPSTTTSTSSTTTVKRSADNIVTVGSKGATGVNSAGKTVRTFAAKTQWMASGIKYINNKMAYRVSTDIYIYQSDTTQPNIVTVNTGWSGVDAVDSSGTDIPYSYEKFKDGTQWKIVSTTTISGKPVYKVSNHEYIWATDANGSGNVY